MSFDTPRRSDISETGSYSSATLPEAPSEPPPDRMAVHAVWEIGLLLLGGGVLFALTQSSTGPFAEGSWDGFIRALAPLVLLACAMSISLRVGAVNLAVGPVALFSAWIFIDASGSGTAIALAMACGAAGFIALVLATLTAWLRVPGWAASGAVGGAIGLWSGTVDEPAAFMLSVLPGTGALAALAAAVGFSMFLGLVGAFTGVRDKLSPIRDTPAGERHGRGGLVFLGILVSTSLAGGAGVLVAWGQFDEAVGAAALPDPILGTVFALGAALLGGTSLLGRRGGVCGTVFAAALLLAGMWLAEARDWGVNPSWIALGALIVGFIVTRLVEAMNTPDEDELESTDRAGALDDLRDDEPILPTQRDDEYDDYRDEDLAAVGSGADPWTGEMPRAGEMRTGEMPRTDPFGQSGAFDDLRGTGTARDGYGYDSPGTNGTRYDDADGRYGRFR